jgi:hypothetical protein
MGRLAFLIERALDEPQRGAIRRPLTSGAIAGDRVVATDVRVCQDVARVAGLACGL